MDKIYAVRARPKSRTTPVSVSKPNVTSPGSTGIANLLEVGWPLSWTDWVDNGAGGLICSRQPYFTGSAWAVRYQKE